ncbi:hypothetical protein HK097_000968 [Rhizophlyctis rosea]|uniref:Calcineurin-like phosphoesterase domain-containing protein n=1 Tax=Rhizophlyctis rosea TaxID=64517 RepID=A0AAD5X4H9_9FUNG|nr:hypothetical protein HK097_000968 [Rhizophlyctis rosea]
MANVTDPSGNWVGNDTIFVQTGDIVDRGPDTIELYKMMHRLQFQASWTGGAVVPLLGNHEVMNMMEDYRYVTEDDVKSFGGLEERKQAWSREGTYLRTLNITALVNGTLFLHGGLHPKWALPSVETLNLEARNHLLTKTPAELWNVPLFGGDGPLWYRGYAMDGEDTVCSVLDKVLSILKANRMVIGHTPQRDGRILSRCKGRVFVIDVGISRVYGGNAAALEIVGDRVKALYPSGKVVQLA